MGIYATNSDVRAPFTRDTSDLVPEQVRRFRNRLEASLGTERMQPIASIVMGDRTVADASEQMVPKPVKAVAPVGAAIPNEVSVWHW